MIVYTITHARQELEGILALQQANLAINLLPNEIQSQGFVTVSHSYEQLAKLNDYEQHIVAKNKEQVIGYLLAMTKQSRYDIPVLVPMFEVFDQLLYNGNQVADYNYLVVGQVCISKAYRGQGLLDKCYEAYKQHYSKAYDFAITEIAKSNTRSLRAHERIGFKPVKTYRSGDVDWVIVLWNWK